MDTTNLVIDTRYLVSSDSDALVSCPPTTGVDVSRTSLPGDLDRPTNSFVPPQDQRLSRSFEPSADRVSDNMSNPPPFIRVTGELL